MAYRKIETEVAISAPARRVWALLTDFARMSSWNPFIKSISGRLEEGASLSVLIAPPGKMAMRFRPTILAVRPEREFRWLGRVLVTGLFDGEHYFLLEPLTDGQTRMIQGENFSGVLVGFLGGALRSAEAGFHAMNAALKREAEAGA
jgi:hypothetical protein